MSPAAARPAGSALEPEASPQQLRDVLAAEPWRALEVAVHPSADAALRQWLWQSDDVELRLGMYEHYRLQRQQVLDATHSLPPAAIQFDAVVAQMPLLLEYAGDDSLEHTALAGETAVAERVVDSEAPNVEGKSTPTVALRFVNGAIAPLTSARVLIGRRPVASAYPDSQVVAVPDPDRQVSSTHALIEVHDGAWRITDLESTNGTRLGDGPHAHVASPGISYIAPQRFFVGTQAVEFVTV